MELLVKKQNKEDSGTIDSSALLSDLVSKFIDAIGTSATVDIQDKIYRFEEVLAAKLEDKVDKATLQYVLENIPELNRTTILKLMTVNETFTLSCPISIVATGAIENAIDKVGTMYYNPITDELRLRKRDKWVTCQTT